MKTWKKVLTGAVLLGIAGALLVYFLLYNKPHRDYERAKPDFELKAEELYFAFINDENVSGEQYNGRVLLLTGEVAGIEQIDELVIVSFIFEEGLFGDEGVRCTMLQSQHSMALQIKEGQSVKIKGLCTGFTGSDVVLEHCSFVN